jgi:pimeloyl-ACP methyl ester carboxylesterase
MIAAVREVPMNGSWHRWARRALVGLAVVGLGLPFTASASAGTATRLQGSVPVTCGGRTDVRFVWLKGFDDPATPDALDRVGVLQVGPASAPNVLVLNPGTSAGSAYFKPLADDIVRRTNGSWQVWSVERRENQLEDQVVLDQYKSGLATTQQLFDYYLGWLADPSITNHFQLIPDAAVSFAKGWGLNVEIQDLHRVVQAAKQDGRRVVMGGHSLGGSITTAYATWDFHGHAGADDLAGLVYIDGGSNPTPVTPEQAQQSLQDLQSGSPWLAFGGIGAPFLGLFSALGATTTVIDPNSPSLAQDFPLLPADLKPPVRATNEAQFGFAVDTKTSPPTLRAAQVHAGQLAASGDPRGWVRAGAITPIQRYAQMLSGTGLKGIDGSAWYHPMRLTIDAGAVADGNPNPAQQILQVDAIHGHDLSKHLRIYAFGAALGGEGVLATAKVLAQQSHIARSHLTLVNRQDTYAHNDPSAASPHNTFLNRLIPFLGATAKLGSCAATTSER